MANFGELSRDRVQQSGFASASPGWTPERRERQRQAAYRLIEEGRLGGPGRGQGRKRKPRMQEFLAEKAREHADLINTALLGMLNSGDKRLQLEAIRQYAAAEDWTERHQREDERELRKLKGDELRLALKLAIADAYGIDPTMLDAIDAESEEIDEQGNVVVADVVSP